MEHRSLWRRVGTLAAAAAGLAIFLIWLLPVLLPFVIGLCAAALVERPIGLLLRKARLSRRLAGFLCVLALYALLLSGLYLLGRVLCGELGAFLHELPELASSLAVPLSRLHERLLAAASCFPDGLGSGLRAGVESLFASGSLLSTRVYSALFDFASGLLSGAPGLFLFLITTVLSSFMFAAELPALRTLMQTKLPQAWREKGALFLTRLRAALGGWLLAQLKLMSITFFILTAGLMLLHVSYPVLFGLVIALVDALPVFGTGTVLIPWALLSFLQDGLHRGIGLLVLYGAAALTRQALEPRMIARQIGLSPLLTLMALYIGFRVAGVGGMLVFPICAILLKQLWDSGNGLSGGA